MNSVELWERYQKYLWADENLGVMLDISRIKFSDEYFSLMAEPINRAFEEMDALERGAVANPDENRRVGHYWLRHPALAPTPEIRNEIETMQARVKQFAEDVHRERMAACEGVPFKHLLVIGIGGSALGPQLVSHALGSSRDRMTVSFFDNTDPHGFDRVLARLHTHLSNCLVVVISKSGGTQETRNGMLEAQAAFEKAGLKFERHAVAVTQVGSDLDRYAQSHEWQARFPMWDWVGGRTSELSAVGLLPAALQGLDVDGLLAGAGAMDKVTRAYAVRSNPAALMALMWHYVGDGRGRKDMVILPYKDQLELFSRYLQQLVMESLGKEKSRDGRVVHQGLAVYGNKGSTDQHAYVQQLRDGISNFFVTFIEVLKDREIRSFEVEPGVTSGDYLSGFLQGTRRALFENGRESLTITVREVNAQTLGMLIALFERSVGFYASLVNINAYHQPGVEAGKKAARQVLAIQHRVLDFLARHRKEFFPASAIASGIGETEEVETVFRILLHLSSNVDHGVMMRSGENFVKATFGLE